MFAFSGEVDHRISYIQVVANGFTGSHIYLSWKGHFFIRFVLVGTHIHVFHVHFFFLTSFIHLHHIVVMFCRQRFFFYGHGGFLFGHRFSRWCFPFFLYQVHPAFWAFTRLNALHFGVHRAGVYVCWCRLLCSHLFFWGDWLFYRWFYLFFFWSRRHLMPFMLG